MKAIGWSFVLVWVTFACNQAKPEQERTAGGTTGSIKGNVSYKEDKKTLPDAGTLVYAVSTTRPNPTATPRDKFKNQYFEAVADVDGGYAFNNLPADTYALVFQSKNAPKKLNYYKWRYSPVLEPLVSEMPVNNLNSNQAKKERLNSFFEDQQVHVKPDLKLTAGVKQVVTQEFIKN